jgi:vacuolar-type H+-ATPase subunit D/Vma8
MEMIALIVSGLALLAAGVCLYLLMQEKKRNQERRATMCDYADNNMVESKEYTDDAVEVCERAFDERIFALQNRLLQEIYSENKKIYARVENLEKGIIPDYEKATAAVNAVNDFNQGISNLLNYDPVSALAAQREKERQGE